MSSDEWSYKAESHLVFARGSGFASIRPLTETEYRLRFDQCAEDPGAPSLLSPPRDVTWSFGETRGLLRSEGVPVESEPPILLDEIPRPTENTWFEVRLVDEAEQPLDGVPVGFRYGTNEVIVTNGDGVARLDATDEGSFAWVKISQRALLDEKLIALAESRLEPAEIDLPEKEMTRLVYQKKQGRLPEAKLSAEVRHTLVILPRHTRVRLIGMHFETHKCFLRPTAMHGVKRVKEIYEETTGELLITGHTDTLGKVDYNEDLSLERAEAVLAYLRDDIDAWLAWYGESKPEKKRWGVRETQYMLSALPSLDQPFYRLPATSFADPKTHAAVVAFQNWSNKTHGTSLKADGIAGPKTRAEIVKRYMELDGVTMPKGRVVHLVGCGPHHAPIAASAKPADEELRRVEFFVFDGPVRPPPPAGGKPILPAGATEYARWDAQMAETIDVSSDEVPPDRTLVKLHDAHGVPMTDVFFRLTKHETEETGFTEDGWVVIATEGFRPERVHLEWDLEAPGKYRYELDVELGCDLADLKMRTLHRLHNLGYGKDQGLDGATRAFQRANGLIEEGLGPDGLPPLMTAARIDNVYAASIHGSPRRVQGKE